jgi:basic membrane protein A
VRKVCAMNTLLRVFRLFLSRGSIVCCLVILFCGISVSREAHSAFRLGLVLDKGGKDDKSFNAAAFKGALRVKEELSAFVKYVEATDDNAFEPHLRAFAQKGFDLVIAIGVSQVDALRKVAQKFPNQHFAIIDGEVDAPNVRSLLFEEHEGAYLVGAIAALVSTSGKVGFIGGMDIPLIRRFELGYASGAKAINSKIKVISNFVGVTGDAWNNPTKAKELAVSQYESGVDIVFSAAGASGSGLFDAAEEKKKFAIGVDSNQNWVKPGYVLTSMVKKVDEAIVATCKETAEGKFTGGTIRYGLLSKGIDYSVDSFNEKLLPEAVRKKAEEIKVNIISGKIKVPDYYKLKR